MCMHTWEHAPHLRRPYPHAVLQVQAQQPPQLAVAAAAAAAGCPPPPPPTAPEADEAEYAWLPLDCIRPFQAGQGAGPVGLDGMPAVGTGDEALQVIRGAAAARDIRLHVQAHTCPHKLVQAHMFAHTCLHTHE